MTGGIYGHVGIVIDVDGDQMTIQDGNYNGESDPWEVAITDWKTTTWNISEYENAAGKLTFANPIGASTTSGTTSTTTTDSQYNIKIATFKEETTTVTTNDPQESSYGPNTVYTMSTETINYYNAVQQYTMPFDYLWQLLVISEDRGFVFELLRTIYESDIEITVNDTLDDTTVTTSHSREAKVTVMVNDEPKEETRTYTTTKIVRTITNTAKVDLTRANVWIVDYKKNYVYKEENNGTTYRQWYEEGEKTLREKTQKILINAKKDKDVETEDKEGNFNTFTDIEDIPDENKLTDEDIDKILTGDLEGLEEGYEPNNIEENNKNVSKEEQQESAEIQENEEVQDNQEEQGNKEAQDSEEGNLVTTIVDIKTFRYKEKNFVTLLATYEKGKTNIINAKTWLFELIEENENTNDMLDLTKYLLYKVTGHDFGVTEFDFSIYEPGSFSDIDGIYGNTVQEKVWYALRKAGYSEEAAAGVLGNIECEAGFDTNKVEDTGVGYGLVQWSDTRRIQYESYAKSKGVSTDDLDTQIEFMLAELNPDGVPGIPADCHLWAESYPYYDGHVYTRDEWLKASSPEQAARAFMTLYERPNFSRENDYNAYERRQKAARKYYEQFKGRSLDSFTGGKVDDVESTPNYCQWDPYSSWASMVFGAHTVADSGCGPTTAAIAITALTGKKVTPDETCKYAYSQGVYNVGIERGCGPAAIEVCAKKWGLNAKSTDSIDEVEKALKDGKIVAAPLFQSKYCLKGGHYICLIGYKDGKTFVRDPNNPTAPGSQWESLRNYIWSYKMMSFTIIG